MFTNTKRMGRWITIAAAAGLVCWAGAEAAKPAKPPAGDGVSYAIVQLDDAQGTWECSALDVNLAGQVVGQVAEDWATSERRAASWSVTGSSNSIQSQLSTLAGGSAACGVNDFGEIVGYGNDSNGRNVGLYWADAGAAPVLLAPVDEDARSYALAINNDGVACGYSVGAAAQAVAWRVTWADGQSSVWGPVPLPTWDEASVALAINNNDAEGSARIAGRFSTAVGTPTAAVAWTVQSLPDGTLVADLVPRIVEADDAEALSVNDGGTVCGRAGWPPEAMVWSETASWTLQRARGIELASAQDLNNSGAIAGWGDTGQIAREAVVWPAADANMIQLNKYLGRKSPFVKLVEASAVNDLGEIVGYGFTEVGGSGRAAFLAIPQ